jgi:hypothetical protein
MEPANIDHDKLLFTSYQHSYVFEKAALLKGIIDNPVSVIDSIQGNDGLQFRNYEAMTSHLKAEIHFSMYHALESMFAMIFALIKQPDDVWVWLSNYKFNKFNEMIAQVANSDISAISEQGEIETIEYLFFKNCPEGFVEQVEVKSAIQNISRILTLCANEMLDKSEYNSYKHGLRILSGDLELRPVNEKDVREETINEVPGFVYLSGKTNQTAKIIPKQYSYQRSYKIIKVSSQLTALMINQRKAEYSKNVNCNIQTVDFRKIDVDDIFSYPSNFYFFA